MHIGEGQHQISVISRPTLNRALLSLELLWWKGRNPAPPLLKVTPMEVEWVIPVVGLRNMGKGRVYSIPRCSLPPTHIQMCNQGPAMGSLHSGSSELHKGQRESAGCEKMGRSSEQVILWTVSRAQWAYDTTFVEDKIECTQWSTEEEMEYLAWYEAWYETVVENHRYIYTLRNFHVFYVTPYHKYWKWVVGRNFTERYMC